MWNSKSISRAGRTHRAKFVRLEISVIVCLFLLVALVSFVSTSFFAQTSQPHVTAYEVVSVKPSIAGEDEPAQTNIAGNRFIAKNLSLRDMVEMAYDMATDDRIANLPPWGHSARFDIQATFEETKVHHGELEQTRIIVADLLADRFQLRSHFEKRVRPVYFLVADKGGSKVDRAGVADKLEMNLGFGDIHLRAAAMTYLVQGVTLMVGRPVIDKTGLTGLYNIDLKCASDQLADTGEARPTVFAALRNQLGLRLVPSKAPVDILVVDRLERPSAN